MKTTRHLKVLFSTSLLILTVFSVRGLLENHFEKRSILTYPARCGVSKVSYKKSTVMYKWEVQGLIKYLDYVKQFDETFLHETDHVKFTSPEDLNGLWKFKIHSSKTQLDPIPQTFISAKYTYEETPKNQRMNIGMMIKVIYGPLYSNANEFTITKPSDKIIQKVKTITNLITTNAVPKMAPIANGKIGNPGIGSSSARRVLPAWFSTGATSSEEESEDDDEKRKNEPVNVKPVNIAKDTKTEKYVEVNRVTVSFETVNIQPLLESLRAQADNPDDENSAVDFTFIINYFIPNDPLVTEQMKCYIGNFTHQLNSFGIQQQPEFQIIKVRENDKEPQQILNKTINKPVEIIETLPISSMPNPPPFVDNLESVFETGEFSDMNILVQDQRVPVHRVILANSSPKLSYLIRTSTNLADFILFDENVGQNATREILRYIYTGQVRNLDSQADKIIIAAHHIGLAKLEKMCTTLLMNDINIENAIRIYSLAKDIDSEALTKAAVAVIRKNKQAVVSQSKEFQKLAAKYPAIIFDLFLS